VEKERTRGGEGRIGKGHPSFSLGSLRAIKAWTGKKVVLKNFTGSVRGGGRDSQRDQNPVAAFPLEKESRNHWQPRESVTLEKREQKRTEGREEEKPGEARIPI